MHSITEQKKTREVTEHEARSAQYYRTVEDTTSNSTIGKKCTVLQNRRIHEK